MHHNSDHRNHEATPKKNKRKGHSRRWREKRREQALPKKKAQEETAENEALIDSDCQSYVFVTPLTSPELEFVEGFKRVLPRSSNSPTGMADSSHHHPAPRRASPRGHAHHRPALPPQNNLPPWPVDFDPDNEPYQLTGFGRGSFERYSAYAVTLGSPLVGIFSGQSPPPRSPSPDVLRAVVPQSQRRPMPQPRYRPNPALAAALGPPPPGFFTVRPGCTLPRTVVDMYYESEASRARATAGESSTAATERTASRPSTPLAPTAAPFEPASARNAPVSRNRRRTRPHRRSNSQISGDQQSVTESSTAKALEKPVVRGSRSLKPDAPIFEPASARKAASTPGTVAQAAVGKSTETLQMRSATGTMEARVKEAQQVDATTWDASDHSSDKDKESLITAENTDPTEQPAVERKPLAHRPRQLEDIDNAVLLAVPAAPVHQAGQEMVFAPREDFIPNLAAQVRSASAQSFVSSSFTASEEPGRVPGGESQSSELTAAEAEVVNRVTQARKEEREAAERALERRRDARFTTERRESAMHAREADYQALLRDANHPFWNEDVSPRLPRAHVRAANPEHQSLVSGFETVFDNLARYRDGYSNSQTSSRRSEEQLGRPVGDRRDQLSGDDPTVRDDPQARCDIINGACHVPYMEFAQTSRSYGPDDPRTEALPPMPPSNPAPQTQEASTHPGTTSSAGAHTAERDGHKASAQSAESTTPKSQPPTSITANRPASAPVNPLRMNTPRRPSRVTRPSPLSQSESLDESEPRPPRENSVQTKCPAPLSAEKQQQFSFDGDNERR